MTLGNLEQERLVLKHYCFDPTMAPPGKSVLSVWCKADYDHWKRLRAEPARYRAPKAQVLEQVIAAQAMPATRQQNPTRPALCNPHACAMLSIGARGWYSGLFPLR